MGMGGPIDLNMDVALKFIERKVKSLEDQEYCLSLVHTAYRAYLNKAMGDKKKK